MYKIVWKTRDAEIPEKTPSFVNRGHIRLWRKQKNFLDKHPDLNQWLYLTEWPDYIFKPTDEDSPSTNGTSEYITSKWEKTPVLKDPLNPSPIDVPTFWVKKEHLLDLMKLFKEEHILSYNFLLDLTAADFLNSPDASDRDKNQGKRFQMIYLLRSLPDCIAGLTPDYRGLRVRVILPVDEGETVPSLTSIWIGANWPEREVFDLMGLKFEGHPELKRILLPENYRGHPLRKDFPLNGIGEDYLIQDLLEEHLSTD